MHSKPVNDDTGDFGPWVKSDRSCPQCGSPDKVFEREWESHCGGFVDMNYECRGCTRRWWVDGGDS